MSGLKHLGTLFSFLLMVWALAGCTNSNIDEFDEQRQPPAFGLGGPDDVTVAEGGAAVFRVGHIEWGRSPPDVLTWERIDGTTVTQVGSLNVGTLTIDPVSRTHDGALFRAKAQNGAGSTFSRTARLTVRSPVRIESQPQNAEIRAGQTATFTVSVSGSLPYSYQWKVNGIDIAGATAATYTTAPATITDTGAQYTVVVGNDIPSSTTSVAATLTVLPILGAPEITRGPRPTTVSEGASALFDVEASGAAVLEYQWLRNGADIARATGQSYTPPAAALADDGVLFSVRVRNAFGMAISSAARLTVLPAATIGVSDVVSLNPDGSLGGLDSTGGGAQHAVSRDGRYVAFISLSRLTGGTACGVFLRDMLTRTTRLITVKSDGTPASPPAGTACNDAQVAMTPDARHVAFRSEYRDLVDDHVLPPTLVDRIYVRDTCIGGPAGCAARTTLVSIDSDRNPIAGNMPSISDDGRYVAFSGTAPGTSTPAALVHDRDADSDGVFDERPAVPDPLNPAHRTIVVSRQNAGTLFTFAGNPMISGTGRFVVFAATAGPNECREPGFLAWFCVYVHDRDANGNGVLDEVGLPGGVRTINVSVNTAGDVASGASVFYPWISADGRVVTFRSMATNLGATNPSAFPLYVHDRDVSGSGVLDTPGNVRTVLASLDALGNEVRTADWEPVRGFSRSGRFVLLEGSGDWAAPPDPTGSQHLYLRDLCIGAAVPVGCAPSTVRLSVRRNGALPAGGGLSTTRNGVLSGDARRVAFTQSGGGLVDLDGDGNFEEHTNSEVYLGWTGKAEQ